MRRPLPPREAGKVHLLVASLAVAGFTTLWRVGHLHKRNEADSGSLALRLTRSLAGASTPGLLPSPPGPLPAERAIRKATSFQATRSARLILALQRRKDRQGLTRSRPGLLSALGARQSLFRPKAGLGPSPTKTSYDDYLVRYSRRTTL
jgi:hypothetical protein